VTLHNAAEEIVAKFGGLESGMDWQNPTLRAQFRSALGENRKPLTERSFPERPQDGGI